MNNKKVKVQKPAVAKALLKNKKPSKSKTKTKTKTKTKHKTLPKIKLNIIVPNPNIITIKDKTRGPYKKKIDNRNNLINSKSDNEIKNIKIVKKIINNDNDDFIKPKVYLDEEIYKNFDNDKLKKIISIYALSNQKKLTQPTKDYKYYTKDDLLDYIQLNNIKISNEYA